jgi:hypothetical protein
VLREAIGTDRQFQIEDCQDPELRDMSQATVLYVFGLQFFLSPPRERRPMAMAMATAAVRPGPRAEVLRPLPVVRQSCKAGHKPHDDP